jgi:hypothetical protein
VTHRSAKEVVVAVLITIAAFAVWFGLVYVTVRVARWAWTGAP